MNEFDKEEHTEDIWYSQILVTINHRVFRITKKWNTFYTECKR